MRSTEHRPTLAMVLFCYMFFLMLVITLTPFRFHWPRSFSVDVKTTRFDFIANILLFVPLGFLFRAAFTPSGDLFNLGALLGGALVSGAIEGLQGFSAGRVSSLTDFLANVSGAWAGAIAFQVIRRSFYRRLVDRLSLELPLMGLFYLLVPLLWLNGRSVGEERSRLWLSPMLGVIGALILAAVWAHRLRHQSGLSAEGVVLLGAAWFGFSSIPAFLIDPSMMAWTCLGVAVLTRVAMAVPIWHGRQDRRFERTVLWMITPIYLAYLIGLVLWPLPFSPGSWRGTIGMAELTNNPGVLPLLRLLEGLTSFTLLGYLAAEWGGRREAPLGTAVGRVTLLISIIAAVGETARGFHPRHVASLIEFLLAGVGGAFGALIYRLQLDAIRRRLVDHPRRRPLPRAAGRAQVLESS